MIWVIHKLSCQVVLSYDVDGNIVTDGSVKDDAYYQAGITRSYSRNDDIVTDNVTGLQWQDNETVEKPWVTQANFDAKRYNDTSGDIAATYCTELSLDGTTWRLPTIKELETIIDYSKDPSIDDIFQHLSATRYFYWSSTTQRIVDPYGDGDAYEGHAWYVEFESGDVSASYFTKSISNSVRCVRGKQLYASVFSRNANEVVSDATTKLQWQDNAAVKDEAYIWSEAIDYCEGLSLDGNNDWRLPNINELFHIADYSQYDPAMNPIFKNFSSLCRDRSYLSSTTTENYHRNVRYVNFCTGRSSDSILKDEYAYRYPIRCVRGGQLDKLKSSVVMAPIIMYLLN